MSENLDLYRPTEIEIEKGIRYLRSFGLPNIGITVQGDVYNSKTNRYLAPKDSYNFTVNNKLVSFRKISLYKEAFKYDFEDPSKILDFKNKDLETDVCLTWDFWNNQKNYILNDLPGIDKILNKLSKNEILNLRYNTIGLYNIKLERYYNSSAKGFYQISCVRNGKQHFISIKAEKLQNSINKNDDSTAPMIIENTTELPKEEIENTTKLPKEEIEMKELPKEEKEVKEVVEKVSSTSNSSILEFINDVLTLDLDEVSSKYNIAKQILKVLKD